MSNKILSPHTAMTLLAAIPLASMAEPQQVTKTISTHKMYEKFVLRLTPEFTHGEIAPSEPYFGGIYNLLSGVHILTNSTDKSFEKSGKALYVDAIKRQGRENDNTNYGDLPASFTQEVDYCFSGSQSVLGGVVVSDGAFALDLRHSASEGVNTYNSVELVMDIATLDKVFKSVGDTVLNRMTIEVYGVELFHGADSLKALAVEKARYAQVIARTDVRKIADATLVNEFNLPAIGTQANGVYLSDLVIVQTDEDGAAVPFDDENAVVSVTVDGLSFYERPVWDIRRAQNARRVQPVPPNVLIVPLVQASSGLGGLSPALLQAGAVLNVKANKLAGQATESCLHIERNYTAK